MINFGALQGGGFQNALSAGLQLGQFARQRQDEKEYKNALATVLMPQGGTSGGQAPQMGGMGGGIVATPEQEAESAAARAKFPNAPQYGDENERSEAMRVIAMRNPQLFTQLQQQEAAGRAAARKAQIFDRALGGDATAMDELARLDYDAFSKLDKAQKDEIAAESKLFGDVSYDLLNTPPAQRRDKFITYAREFPQYQEEINALAFAPPEEQERKLRALALQAGLGQKLYEMDKPQTLNVQPGAGVYERDSRGNIRTVIAPNYGGAPAFSPVPQPGAAPAISDIDAELRRRGVF
jgi:hypothetical protein